MDWIGEEMGRRKDPSAPCFPVLLLDSKYQQNWWEEKATIASETGSQLGRLQKWIPLDVSLMELLGFPSASNYKLFFG